MPGPVPKRNDQRQGHRTRTELVVGTISRTIPPVPRGLLKRVRVQWKMFWESDVAQVVSAETDLPAVTRLFTLRDERERAYVSYRKKRLVEGSQGQPVVNPLFRLVPQMDAEIRQLEDRFGLTPHARAKLGIALGGAKRSLEEMARDAAGDTEDDDPRVTE